MAQAAGPFRPPPLVAAELESLAFLAPAGMTSDVPNLMWPAANPPTVTILMTPEGSSEVVDLKPYMQYLLILWRPRESAVLGPDTFRNASPYGWNAYAHANVYNPNNWSRCSQHWKTKLGPAYVLNDLTPERQEQLTTVYSEMGGAGGDFGAVTPEGITLLNNH